MALEAKRGGKDIDLPLHNLGTRWGGGWLDHAPAAITPGNSPDINYAKGIGTDLDGCGRSRPSQRGSKPEPSSP